MSISAGRSPPRVLPPGYDLADLLQISGRVHTERILAIFRDNCLYSITILQQPKLLQRFCAFHRSLLHLESFSRDHVDSSRRQVLVCSETLGTSRGRE